METCFSSQAAVLSHSNAASGQGLSPEEHSWGSVPMSRFSQEMIPVHGTKARDNQSHKPFLLSLMQ